MAQAAAKTTNDAAGRVPLSMSHIGLYVHDVPMMEDFYTRVLGFTVTDRGKVRGADIVFTSWDPKDHHQVILVAGRPKELAYNHINQISFRVASVEDLQAVWRQVKDEPGVTRYAADGPWQCVVALFPRSGRQPPRNLLRYAMVHRAAVSRRPRSVAAGRANSREVRCVLPHRAGLPGRSPNIRPRWPQRSAASVPEKRALPMTGARLSTSRSSATGRSARRWPICSE